MMIMSLLEGIPIVQLTKKTAGRLFDEYLLRYADGEDLTCWNLGRRVTIVISCKTGVILLVRGVSVTTLGDEWFNLTRRSYPMIRTVGGVFRINVCGDWIDSSHKCEKYPLNDARERRKENIICILDVVPGKRRSMIPSEVLEHVIALSA
jgi:hypothetical protein